MHPKTTLPLLAFALSCAAPLGAAEEKTAVPFRALAFDAACAAAKAEGRLVFIDFYTTWCEPCKRLDKDTWTDAGVGKLVGDKAVALKLDAEKEGRDAAKTYKIAAYPTLLLLKADGNEVDRLVGYREPALFKAEFAKLLALAESGRTGLDEARAQVSAQTRAYATPSSEPEDAQPHYELARRLLTAGQSEEALKELVWCWDEGIKDPEFVRIGRSRVPADLARLARDYPPARAVLIARRDRARDRALANKGGGTTIQDLITLNRELRSDDDTIAVFDKLPDGDRRRVTISIYLFDNFVEQKRYADALLFNLPESFLMEIERAKAQQKKGGDPAVAAVRSTVTRISKRIEALAATGKIDEAVDLTQRLIALDNSDTTKKTLRERLERAGHPELLADPGAKP
jgi:thiol-disulfide isomerase/thioredoxin